MIYYSKRYWGLPVLFRFYGSALPRALPAAIIAAIITVTLQVTVSDEIRRKWRHPYPYQIFTFVAGFLLVFRCAFTATTGWT
jgi:predicted membrane chloride channel (bestrophin family)